MAEDKGKEPIHEIDDDGEDGHEPTPLIERAKVWLKRAFLISALSITALAAVSIVQLVGEGLNEGGSAQTASNPNEAPRDAAEIIALEFEGKIKLGSEPPPGSAPRQPLFEPATEVVQNDEAENEESKRKPASVIGAAVKSTALKVAVDAAGLKVTKNLDKKKVSKFLAQKLEQGVDCWPAEMAKAKSVKAVIKIGKGGAVSDIKVTPKGHQTKIVKCLKKRIGDKPVALKPKNKAVAEVTVPLKVSR